MRSFIAITQTGLVAVLSHPLRSIVCVSALVIVLVPYLMGMAIHKGLEAEAEISVASGADLYVMGQQFGRPAAVPLASAQTMRGVNGVTRVVPRIVGEVKIGKDQLRAVVVGLPASELPGWSATVLGDVPQPRRPFELVVGCALAKALRIQIGSIVPPFYRSEQGEHLSRVVGIFRRDAPLWQANLILTTFEAAQAIFDQTGYATDMLVWCRPGYQQPTAFAIEQELHAHQDPGAARTRFRVTAREDLAATMPRALLHREGLLHTHYILALVIAILAMAAMSGIASPERRREIGILKSLGWSTDAVLLRSIVESSVLCISGACLALIIAWIWLRVGNGFGIVGSVIAGAGASPEFVVPFRLTPGSVFLAFALAAIVVYSGSMYSTWRAAVVEPRQAMN